MTEMVSVGSFQNVPNALAAFLLLDHFFGEVSEERRPSTLKREVAWPPLPGFLMDLLSAFSPSGWAGRSSCAA
jgi:hypothetical protein